MLGSLDEENSLTLTSFMYVAAYTKHSNPKKIRFLRRIRDIFWLNKKVFLYSVYDLLYDSNVRRKKFVNKSFVLNTFLLSELVSLQLFCYVSAIFTIPIEILRLINGYLQTFI